MNRTNRRAGDVFVHVICKSAAAQTYTWAFFRWLSLPSSSKADCLGSAHCEIDPLKSVLEEIISGNLSLACYTYRPSFKVLVNFPSTKMTRWRRRRQRSAGLFFHLKKPTPTWQKEKGSSATVAYFSPIHGKPNCLLRFLSDPSLMMTPEYSLETE